MTMIKRMIGTVVGLFLIALGVAGFLLFTSMGNDGLSQVVQTVANVEQQTDQLEWKLEQMGESWEKRWTQWIPDTVRPFLED